VTERISATASNSENQKLELPTPQELLAQKILKLSPELQSWALDGYSFGHFNDTDLENQNKLKEEKERFHTAVHENAHALVAQSLGWQVLIVSIIQEGNALGFTKAVPPFKRIDQLLLEKMAICFAGMAGEELVGDNDHRGCSSDFAQAKFFAEILDRFSPEHRGQFFSLVESQKNLARGIVNRAGVNYLKDKSWILLDLKEKTSL
jgi:hypothetical protein